MMLSHTHWHEIERRWNKINWLEGVWLVEWRRGGVGWGLSQTVQSVCLGWARECDIAIGTIRMDYSMESVQSMQTMPQLTLFTVHWIAASSSSVSCLILKARAEEYCARLQSISAMLPLPWWWWWWQWSSLPLVWNMSCLIVFSQSSSSSPPPPNIYNCMRIVINNIGGSKHTHTKAVVGIIKYRTRLFTRIIAVCWLD